ncbi:anaerobic sulfatase maturase [candidate division KSB1 bacterium]|nr:anaerobic sulfatase maturase [candidate division KSB1 bacterium]
MLLTKPLSSILIKPAGPDCNMRCAYCFYLEKSALFKMSKTHRMNLDVLRETVRQVMEGGGQQVSFGWQGGEPSLMGLDFFRRAVEYQKQFGQSGQVCSNGFQTNGTLMDAEWARFFKSAQFLVGLSLDGPEHVHDHYRKLAGGQSSYKQVIHGRDVLLEHEVDVNALVVVNDYSVQFAEEIYTYHKANGLAFMQFIPCVEPDPEDTNKTAPFSVSPEPYGKFLVQLFDLWINDFQDSKPTTFVRWFDSLFFSYVNLPAPECTLLPECGIYTVVEHNGDVYACDFFVDPEWKLGNIMEDSLPDLLNSPKQNEFGAIKSNRAEECSDCPWLMYCQGGCPKDRQGESGMHGGNYLCASYKRFFKHADPIFRDMAVRWKREQLRQDVAYWEAQSGQKMERNALCPCGSGKKYKQCCGS